MLFRSGPNHAGQTLSAEDAGGELAAVAGLESTVPAGAPVGAPAGAADDELGGGLAGGFAVEFADEQPPARKTAKPPAIKE